jgi:hypothetical protein
MTVLYATFLLCFLFEASSLTFPEDVSTVIWELAGIVKTAPDVDSASKAAGVDEIATWAWVFNTDIFDFL